MCRWSRTLTPPQAHFMPRTERQVFVELPMEDSMNTKGYDGRWRRSMNGAQAASNLGQHLPAPVPFPQRTGVSSEHFLNLFAPCKRPSVPGGSFLHPVQLLGQRSQQSLPRFRMEHVAVVCVPPEVVFLACGLSSWVGQITCASMKAMRTRLLFHRSEPMLPQTTTRYPKTTNIPTSERK